MGFQRVYPGVPASDETLKIGQKNTVTAGTAVPLSTTSISCNEILIQVKRTNTGRIYIGGASILNNNSGGVFLDIPVAGTTAPSLPLSAQNLNQIYINSTVDAEGVTFLYW